ncbi:MAG: FAD-binding oxidoreductase [Betaproteobacteria bacterium]|nr:FAD-binding oxidoreductase [Betaproteobacteria bacterium]PWB58935.1 MAG: hydroxyacid dehydrogenase [Betaproteobacteria bacterium]
MNDRAPLPATLVERLRAIVGDRGLLTEAPDLEPYAVDWRGQIRGRPALLVRPASTQETADVVALLAGAGVGIVPQAGNTSLCGASVPDASGTQVILNVSRMNRVRAVDLQNNTVTVEAGCVLAELQRVAADNDRFFPLSLGAEGSCEVGGNISTNAGGTQVLRYGNMREQVLGLEVVLPDGRVWDGLRGLRKDNTGYDLKHLFIGAEGTLGIVTAAVLKLYPRPRAIATALVAVPDPAAAVDLLGRLRAACGERVTGFELIARVCLDLVFRHIADRRDPFATPYPWYALVELFDSSAESSLAQLLEDALGEAAEAGVVTDAVIASNESQRLALWELRENASDAQKAEGVSVKHDVSVPVSRIVEFIGEADRALGAAFPGIRTVAFGHVGDGNLHYNAFPPPGEAPDFGQWTPQVNRVVYGIVQRLGGSISAEHGIGTLKRDELPHYKAALELDLMRAIKGVLDPRGIMNPGKVLRP